MYSAFMLVMQKMNIAVEGWRVYWIEWDSKWADYVPVSAGIWKFNLIVGAVRCACRRRRVLVFGSERQSQVQFTVWFNKAAAASWDIRCETNSEEATAERHFWWWHFSGALYAASTGCKIIKLFPLCWM